MSATEHSQVPRRAMSPTRRAIELLRLPIGVADWVDDRRAPVSSELDVRRSSILEAFYLVVLVGLAVSLLGAQWLDTDSSTRRWIFAAMVPATFISYYMCVLRGMVRPMQVMLLATTLGGSVTAQMSGVSAESTLAGYAVATLVTSYTENVSRTLIVGVTGAVVSLLLAGSNGATSVELLYLGIPLGFLILICCIGSAITTRVFREMYEKDQHNLALNLSLERANKDLEERVAQRTRELEQLTIRDELTGLYNRRHLMQQVEDYERNATPAAFVMIDVDHFKQINDTFGHAVGDVVLRRIAHQIHREVRPGDVVVRIGGEEFAVLLPRTTVPEALVVAERVRKAVEDLAWTDIRVPGDRTTVSMGVTGTDEETHSRLLVAADHALYASKRSGRNRVSSSSATVTQAAAP